MAQVSRSLRLSCRTVGNSQICLQNRTQADRREARYINRHINTCVKAEMLTNVHFSEKDHRSESNLTTPLPPHVLASNGPELKGRDVSSVFIRGLCALSFLRMQSSRKKNKKKANVGMKGCQLPLWWMMTLRCMLMQILRSFISALFSESLWLFFFTRQI